MSKRKQSKEEVKIYKVSSRYAVMNSSDLEGIRWREFDVLIDLLE